MIIKIHCNIKNLLRERNQHRINQFMIKNMFLLIMNKKLILQTFKMILNLKFLKSNLEKLLLLDLKAMIIIPRNKLLFKLINGLKIWSLHSTKKVLKILKMLTL